MTSLNVSEEALKFIKSNRKQLINKFADLNYYFHDENPASYFMAGAPGAGKTEYSKSFIKEMYEHDHNIRIVRIDPDEIREILPTNIWTGCNADELSRATSKGVEILYDYALHNYQNLLMDGTFSNYDVAYKNVTRSLSKGRRIGLYYVYQRPMIAWKFTKIREVEEGRHVPKAIFIDSFFGSINNVNRIKKELGSQITLSLVIKDIKNKIEKYEINIQNVDSYIKERYNRDDLDKLLD